MPKLPSQYLTIQKRYKGFIKAVEDLGKASKAAGPVAKKTAELIQLAAAAAVHSEGSVHSHARRIHAQLRRLEEVLATTPSVEPERPWHHYPGTPGWRAAGKRAVAAMRRLLQGAGRPAPSTS